MNSVVSSLPINHVLGDVKSAISQGKNVILQAAPGAGKSTAVPVSLLDVLQGGKILVMQPRRVVVKNLATYLARCLGEDVGQTVGYRIRGEVNTSHQTRIEIITEGILARMIHSDPELEGVVAIVFDEFHERSIHSDYGLALALEVQEGLRDDLRLIIMSATFDAEVLTTIVPNTKIIVSEGRQYPVNTHYWGNVTTDNLVAESCRCVLHAIQLHTGDILVFLPGARWIKRAQRELAQSVQDDDVIIVPLYGGLNAKSQMDAISPAPKGKRKVILATNIAETSLTLPGVKVVVDSGREQQAVFHATTGLTQLNTQIISKASATQRQGRAGRVAEGDCYRLWSPEAHERLSANITPQILREDISGMMLDALAWGTKLDSLALLDKPTAGQFHYAGESLKRIGAIMNSGKLSGYGKALTSLPCPPELAHCILKAQEYAMDNNTPSVLYAACCLVAVIESSFKPKQVCSLEEFLSELSLNQQQDIFRQAKRYLSQIDNTLSLPYIDQIRLDDFEIACVLGLSARLAKWRSNIGYTMFSGAGATLRQSGTKLPTWLTVLSGLHKEGEVAVGLYLPIDSSRVYDLLTDSISLTTKVEYDSEKQRLFGKQVKSLGAIVIENTPASNVAPDAYANAWLEYLTDKDLAQWSLGENGLNWLNKVKLARNVKLRQPNAYDDPPSWPLLTKSYLTEICSEHLRNELAACKTLRALENLDWSALLSRGLAWSQVDSLQNSLPDSLAVPSGFKRKLTYMPDGSVKLSVKMQEMYGCINPIKLADNQVIITVELLSPAERPIQTTQDLGAFWKGSYVEIQKEMKGRYPKHYWPADPTTAQATTKTKRAMN